MADPSPVLWTTDDVPAPERADYWREAICSAYVPLAVEPALTAGFGGSVLMQSWRQVRVSRVVSRAQRVTRQPEDNSADCLVSLQVRGTGRVTQDGRTATLPPGAMALYDPARSYRLDFDDAFEQVVVQFPREELRLRNIDPRAVAARSCTGGLADVTHSLVRAVLSAEDSVHGSGRDLLARQLLDCLATTLAGAPHAGVPLQRVARDARRAAERQAALTCVEQHLTDPRLSVAFVAQHLRRSPRSLQKLFAEDGTELHRHIRTVRIERATRALVDPLGAARPISRVAADFGYADAAHFARVFREHHGMSPSDFRRARELAL